VVNIGILQRACLRLGDISCSFIAFVLSYLTLPWLKWFVAQVLADHRGIAELLSAASPDSQLPPWGQLSWIAIVATLASALALEYGDDTEPLQNRKVRHVIMRQALSTTGAMSALAILFYALRVPPYSRLFVCSYLGWLFALTVGYRLLSRARLGASGSRDAAQRRTVIAGRPKAIEQFLSLTQRSRRFSETAVSGCLLTTAEEEAGSLSVPVLGDIASLGDLLIHEPIDEVVVLIPLGETPWLAAAIERCDYFRVSMHVVHEGMMHVELSDLVHPNSPYPFPSIMLVPEEELASQPLLWKRLIDIVVSGATLVLLSPVMLAIALAIKVTTPDLPVFYPWNVVGYRGRRFKGYKFTTMVADADDRKTSLAALNEMSGPVFKIRNDPRITPLGRFLRKYSLNELPQLWSVLKGDMSLVGPRPAGPHELIHYEWWHKRKLSVRPGITCYWQVRGRNAISNFDDWVMMDLEYIKKRSIRTDMTILFKTLPAVFRGTGS
jgi:exopolysaccharide biosynthesis polyprenyl glycosylphosphotransferase